MNALANSQAGELEKFLKFGFPNNAGPVTYRRYTGQEKEDERAGIIASPPDILLTNYVMLELLLARPYEKGLIEAAKGLRFLVLDELHTYRGRQGTDVALLVWRVREATKATNLQTTTTPMCPRHGGQSTFDGRIRLLAAQENGRRAEEAAWPYPSGQCSGTLRRPRRETMTCSPRDGRPGCAERMARPTCRERGARMRAGRLVQCPGQSSEHPGGSRWSP